SGVWQETTGNIQRITIKETGMSPGGECALAIFEVAPPGQLPAYQPQLWYYSPSPEDATQYEFAPAATPPNMMSRLSGTDWIKAWHDILDEELELASRLDTTINLPQRNLEETTEEG